MANKLENKAKMKIGKSSENIKMKRRKSLSGAKESYGGEIAKIETKAEKIGYESEEIVKKTKMKNKPESHGSSESGESQRKPQWRKEMA